jgi:hypothetical protein
MYILSCNESERRTHRPSTAAIAQQQSRQQQEEAIEAIQQSEKKNDYSILSYYTNCHS